VHGSPARAFSAERGARMETRLTLRPGMPGTKRLLARYGERLVAGADATYIAAQSSICR